MAWNGIGTYVLNALYSPEVNGTVIDANRYNGLMADIAGGLNNCMTKDGQNAATADIPFGGFKATGLGDGNASGEAITWNQTTDVRIAGNVGLGLSPSHKLDLRIDADSSGGATTYPQVVQRLAWLEGSGQNLGSGEGVAIGFGHRLEADGSTYLNAAIGTSKLNGTDADRLAYFILAVSPLGTSTASDIFSTGTILYGTNENGPQLLAEENIGGLYPHYSLKTNPTMGLRMDNTAGARLKLQTSLTGESLQAFSAGTTCNTILGKDGGITSGDDDGYVSIPIIDTTPSGAPSADFTSRTTAPMCVSASNNRLYFYVNGAWKYAALV